MHRPILIAVFALVFSPILCITASGQVSETQKALAAVKENYRAPLTQLVNDFLRSQESQQWGHLYDILSPTYTRGQSRDDYIRERRSLTSSGRTMFILDFTLRRMYVNDPFDDQYSFYGCANVYSEGQTKLANTHIDVVLENNVWRFSGIGLFVTCVPFELDCER